MLDGALKLLIIFDFTRENANFARWILYQYYWLTYLDWGVPGRKRVTVTRNSFFMEIFLIRVVCRLGCKSLIQEYQMRNLPNVYPKHTLLSDMQPNRQSVIR